MNSTRAISCRHTGRMSNIDKQRIAAVRKLEAMGYVFHEHDWTGPAIPATFEADAMHALLVLRADAISHNRSPAIEPLSAIFPRHMAPVVRQAADGEREAVMMSWGFILLQNRRAPRPVTNVRDDKILTSTFWKSSFQERRCLVPAISFCEPNGDVKPATWHWFAIKGDEERPLFAFPGIWKRYRGPVKKDGPNVEIETYSFLTTTPNSLVSTINHERMPVLLTREDEFETWLRGTQKRHSPSRASIPRSKCGSCEKGSTSTTC
jgi:putative SOS response-associated peptidase YedK